MAESVDPTIQIQKDRFYNAISNDPIARVSLEFIATVIFIIVLFALAIRPTITTINTIHSNLEKLQTYNSNLLTKIESLKTLTTLYQNNKQKFDMLDETIPAQAQFPLFEKQLRFLVTQNELSILNLTFSEVPLIADSSTINDDKDKKLEQQLPEDDYEKLTFNLAATGDYEKIKNFVSQLQTLNRLVTIQTFTISQASNKEGRLNFTISGAVYFGL